MATSDRAAPAGGSSPSQASVDANRGAPSESLSRFFDLFSDSTPPGPGGAYSSMKGSGAGGYRFDPDALSSLITRWENVHQGLVDDSVTQQRALASAKEPSNDTPAVRQAGQVRDSIRQMIAHNLSMQKNALAYITALKKANGTYVQHDTDISEALNLMGTDNPSTGKLYQ